MITVLSPQGVVRGSYENNMPESTPYFDDLFTDNLETMETSLRFSVPLESPDSEWLEGFSTVLYPDKDGNLRELTVINVWEDWSQEQPVKTAVCEDASIDSLLKTHTVPFVAGSLEEAIHGALAASDWQFILAADTLNIGYQLIEVKEYSNVRSVLETIRQAYGVEYRFVVKFDGARITRQLQVYKEYGQHTGKYFIYNRDLTNIEREVDFSNVFTAALPYWIEDDAAQTIAGYTPRNPVKGFRKDYTMDNVQHIAAHDEFDRTDKSKMLIFKASSNNPELAYLEACNKLLDYISPTYTYTVNVLLLENVLGFEGTEEIHLGDYVWLKEKVGDAEIGLEARVIQLTSSHTSPEQDEVVFTNFKEISVADSDEVNALRDLIQQIQEQQDEISEAVTQTTVDIAILQQGQAGIITDLEGKSSISIGDTPNPNPQQGDTWFTDAVDPETGKIYSTIKVWNAVTNDWEPRYSAKDAEEALEAANEAAQAGAAAKAAADAAKDAADDATAAGEAASQKADQAAADAATAKAEADAIKVDVGKLQTDVGNVQIDVGKAQTDASKALTDSADAITKVGQVDSKVTTVTNDVNGMKTTISDIQTTQGETTQKLTEVTEDVDGLTVTVGQVKTTADGALSKATTVETTVNGLKTTVGEVKTTADGAMSKASQVEQTAEGLKTTITAVETTVNNLEVGARNYLPNSESPKFESYLSSSVAYEENVSVPEWKATNAVRHTVSGGTGGTLAAILRAGRTVTAGTKYIHSIYIKNEGTTTIRINNNLSGAMDVAAGETKRVVFKPAGNAAGTASMQFLLYRTNAADVQQFVAWHAMIAEGTIVNDWVPSPDDMATVAKVTQVETTVDGLKTTVSEVKTTADGALQKATQVEQTAEGLKTTITAVETTVNRIDGGGSNLISNGGFENDLVGWTQPSGFTITTAESHSGSKALAINNVGSAGRAIGRRINVPVVPTRKYEVSYWYKTTADANGVEGNQKLRIGQTNGTLINALGWDGASTEWSQKSQIYTAGTNIFEWSITLTASHTVGTVWWDDISIVDVTDREATNAQVTQISATVDGLTTTVGQVKTTADSALTKATQVEQTANGLTTTVATIQTDIVDLTNRFPDYNFQKQSPKPVAQDTSITATYDSSLIIRNNATSERRIYWSLNSIEVGKSYNIKAKVNKSAAGQVGFRIGTAGDFITFSGPANTTKFWVTGTIAPTTAGTAFSIWLPAGSALRVDELYIYEANTNITSSQITQLSDNINLKVDKNGVIAQINVSSEGILIDGKYVRITGTTTIDNGVIKTAAIADLAVTTAKIANLAVGTAKIGDAAITNAKIGNLAVTTAKIADLAVTDAKIGSLSANKITTGTLDAGVISVINLNASNITSGTLSGLRVESPYDVPIASGATSNRRGALVITDGYLRNVYQTYVRSSGTVTGNGELTLTHEALSAVSRTGASTTVVDNSMQLHAFGLTLQNSAGQGGTLSFQDLYSQATTSLMPASGWSQYSNDPSNGNHPTVTRQGRLVTLAGAFSNNNQLPADNNSYTMTTIPVGYRPAQLVKWLAKGSGTSIFMITVESNGTLYINYRLGSASGGFGYVVNASGNLFNIAGSYSAADI